MQTDFRADGRGVIVLNDIDSVTVSSTVWAVHSPCDDQNLLSDRGCRVAFDNG